MSGALLAVIPQPDPLPVPGPTGLFWFLLTLTFFLHVLPMNFVLGGSVIALTSRFVGGDPARAARHRDLERWISRAMPVAVAATVSFGVAPLLFVQALYGRLFFTSSVIMAWFWFAVIPLLLIGYSGTYVLAFRGEKLGQTARIVVASISTLCFAAIAFLYTNNMTLLLRPDVFQERYRASGAGLQLDLDDPTLWPRYLHFFMSAIAVAGMTIAHYGSVRMRRDADFGAWVVKHGVLWFVVGTVASMGAGIWWLGALPRPILMRLMGGSAFAAAVLGLGIAFGLLALVLMGMAITAGDPRKPLRASGGALLLTIVCMILARDQVRRGALEMAGFTPNGWVAPQWGPILLFAVLLVVAIGLVVWMVRALARGRPANPTANG